LATGLNELAVIALTLVVTLGLERLFDDRSFLRDLLVIVVVSHLLAIVCRRTGLGTGSSAIISAAGLLVVANLVLFPETADRIIPTGDTFRLLGDDLDLAWLTFSGESAPVEPLRGLVVVAGAALWWAAALADWAAFRLRSQLEAIAPATTVFVFTALLGDGSRPAWHGGLYAAALGAVILTMRINRRARDEVWVADGAEAALSTSMRVGTAAAVGAIVVGVFVGPALPDAGEQLLDPSEWDNGPETRRVLSPLVEINASLVEQSRFEMFSVQVSSPDDRAYWRQMALTTFDGRSWSRSSNFDDARGPVGSDIDASVPRRTLRQTITTSRLGGIYLPAAYEVSNVVSSEDVELEYEVETGALVVKRGSEVVAARGFTYTIESAIPDYSPASLPTDATAGLDPGFVAEHTALPAPCSTGETSADRCWPDTVTALAEEITAGAASDYERVRRLQDHFLDPANFTYDLQVSQRHDVNSIEDFLQVVRAGYCEQFASAFASMARSLGIPARVAVGFTWGEWDDTRQEYVVRGEHAHAWPEVYFAGVGWVVFDPTPGRAPANNGDVTGQAAAQLNENDQGNQGGQAAPPTTIPPAASDSTTGPGEDNPFFEDEFDLDFDLGEEPVGAPTTPDGTSWLRVLIAVAGVAMILGVVPLTRFVLHRRRFARVAADPVGRAEFAWDEAAAALRLVGFEPHPSETPDEFAERALRAPRSLGPIDQLASAVTTLRYAAPADPARHVRTAETAASAITTVCRDQIGLKRRLAEALDPRTVTQN